MSLKDKLEEEVKRRMRETIEKLRQRRFESKNKREKRKAHARQTQEGL